MVNHCANPQCRRPLHYLRDGRVYVFNMSKPIAIGDQTRARMEHFWLCGTCSERYVLVQARDRSVGIITRLEPSTAPSVFLPSHSSFD